MKMLLLLFTIGIWLSNFNIFANNIVNSSVTKDVQGQPKIECPIPQKGGINTFCKHCGCRMRIKEEELEKNCEVCKCNKKNKECIEKNKKQ